MRRRRPADRRDDHRASPALQPQRDLPGRHAAAPLLPAGAQARDAPRGARARGDRRQPEVLPRHRQRAAPARREGERRAVARAASPRTPRSSSTRRRSTRAGALDRLEAFASFHGPDFYRLPRNTARVTLRARAAGRRRAELALRRRRRSCRCAPARRSPGDSRDRRRRARLGSGGARRLPAARDGAAAARAAARGSLSDPRRPEPLARERDVRSGGGAPVVFVPASGGATGRIRGAVRRSGSIATARCRRARAAGTTSSTPSRGSRFRAPRRRINRLHHDEIAAPARRAAARHGARRARRSSTKAA